MGKVTKRQIRQALRQFRSESKDRRTQTYIAWAKGRAPAMATILKHYPSFASALRRSRWPF